MDGSAEDPFHDPRVAADRATIAITGVSTSIADMMACFQTVARWSPETNAVAAVLVVRLSKLHALTHGNRERVVMISLLLAQKVVDDQPLVNADLPEVYRIWDTVDRTTRAEEGMNDEHPYTRRTQISLKQVNALEVLMLQTLDYNVHVTFANALYLTMVSLPFVSDGPDGEAGGDDSRAILGMMDRVTRKRELVIPACTQPATRWAHNHESHLSFGPSTTSANDSLPFPPSRRHRPCPGPKRPCLPNDGGVMAGAMGAGSSPAAGMTEEKCFGRATATAGGVDSGGWRSHWRLPPAVMASYNNTH